MSELVVVPERRLGKAEHKADERTLMLARYMADISIRPTFNFDKGRAAIPLRPWGNNDYGNCVEAAKANAILRLERVEQRRTLPIVDNTVIWWYQRESIRQFGPPAPMYPGDARDQGLFMLNAFSSWRHEGREIQVGKNLRTFKIAAYGELDPNDTHQLRQAIYLLYGIHMGFWLPRAAARMPKVWDYKGETGPEWEPGSWGGHAVFSKRYDTDGIHVLTWGEEILITDAFVKRYCDEAWAVVDQLDVWRATRAFDVDAMLARLREVGARGVE